MKSLMVPFKTPVDYWISALDRDPTKINWWPEIQKTIGWDAYDCDLHVYPHVHAKAAMLSMGCPNQCYFCPSAAEHKGKIHHGDPEIILPYYSGQRVHFMDENFFFNDMDAVLPLLKKYDIQWLAMADNKVVAEVFDKYGEDYLYDCGIRVLEIGLENVALMNKVKEEVPHENVAFYYLNMTCLPGETKETIAENAEWMRARSVKHPIHFNNGLWYSPGQFYYPYGKPRKDGAYAESTVARTRPTYIPNSLLEQDYVIASMEKTNYYCQLMYDFKLYPLSFRMRGNVGDFINVDWRRALWMIAGLRCGGIV